MARELTCSRAVFSNISSDAAPSHPILRFIVNSFFILVIAGCQWLYRHLIYHRFVEDRAAQFVDLLSFTNIRHACHGGRCARR